MCIIAGIWQIQILVFETSRIFKNIFDSQVVGSMDAETLDPTETQGGGRLVGKESELESLFLSLHS